MTIKRIVTTVWTNKESDSMRSGVKLFRYLVVIYSFKWSDEQIEVFISIFSWGYCFLSSSSGIQTQVQIQRHGKFQIQSPGASQPQWSLPPMQGRVSPQPAHPHEAFSGLGFVGLETVLKFSTLEALSWPGWPILYPSCLLPLCLHVPFAGLLYPHL